MLRRIAVTFMDIRGLVALVAVGIAVWQGHALAAQQPAVPPNPLYEYREQHDPNGTGKFFMGREIAQVMGHQAADWLDRPEREAEESVSLLIRSLELKPGQSVLDLGAGSGTLTFPIARQIAPKGKVYAVDIQPEMLAIIRRRMREYRISNIVPVLGAEADPKVPPSSMDLILLVDVYHELSLPYEMTRAMVRALKPGGRLALVEYRLEDPEVPIKLVHKMSEAQVRKEMSLHPVEWAGTVRSLPRQHLIFFRRSAK